MARHHPDPQFATTLAHGLAVLQAFSVERPALSNQQLAQRTGLSKATISRLTGTLAARGLLVFDAQLRRYRMGCTTLTLGYPLLASLPVRQRARARMQQLADEVGGTVSLGLRDRLGMVYVETSRGHELAGWRPDIGARVPLLPTAIGRAWLSQAPPALRDAVWAALQAAEPAQAAAHATALRQAASSLRRHGWCLSRGDWRPEVHAVAVPLAPAQEGQALVFNCGVLATRLGPRALEQEVAPQLLRLVRALEAELQHDAGAAP